jgi:Kdo2-lipid IVA lauroyltransferase/acyltransferase
MKKVRYILEAAFILPLFFILKLLPIDTASALMGGLGRLIGKYTKATTIARKNLEMIFPKKNKTEIEKIISGVWDNMGRMVGELPHVNSMPRTEFRKRVRFINPPKHPEKVALYVTSHYGNFELAARIFHEVGVPVNLVYRTANNPYMDTLINKQRSTFGAKLITKGVAGVRKILEAIERKESIALMIDQRTNTGIDVLFMGVSAKTTQLPANLAIKYGVPVIFFKMSRKKNAYFEVEFSNPVHYMNPMKANEIMEDMGARIAKWIKKDPKQWFWVHKRWGKL